MLEDQLMLVIGLLLAIIFLTVVSTKLNISSPLFLVMAGLDISLLPGIPPVKLKPDMLFFVLLPPLLYRAAWNTNWRDFWADYRSISLHGIGSVIVITAGVGCLALGIIPNFSLAEGFLLGNILAPPDALVAMSILQKLCIPRRILTILEGKA